MKNKGFTLIEILVVATIIGLLSVVGIISYSQFTKTARDARRKSDVENIRTALESYKSNTNCYPKEDTGDVPPATLVTNSYIRTIPKDPKSNANYVYVGSGCTGCTGTDCTSYTLSASLESIVGSSYTSNPLGSIISP